MPTATHDDSEDDDDDDDDDEEKNDGEEEKGNGAPYNGDDGAIVTRKSDTHLEAKGGAPSSPGTSLLDTEGAGAGAGPGADAEGSGLLCSAGEDGVVRIWEHASGACLKALHGHEGEVYAVAELSQSTRTRGLLLATAGEDATVRVWSPAGIRGRCLQVRACVSPPLVTLVSVPARSSSRAPPPTPALFSPYCYWCPLAPCARRCSEGTPTTPASSSSSTTRR